MTDDKLKKQLKQEQQNSVAMFNKIKDLELQATIMKTLIKYFVTEKMKLLKKEELVVDYSDLDKAANIDVDSTPKDKEVVFTLIKPKQETCNITTKAKT